MTFFSDVWAWLNTSSASLPGWVLLLCALAGVGLALWPVSWRLGKYAATYVHEAGHAVAAIATVRRLGAIRLEADGSGTTSSAGTRGIGAVITSFAGYPAPALAAMGLVAGVTGGNARWATAAGVAVVALLLLSHRSVLGLLVSVLLGAPLIVVSLVFPAGEPGLLMLLAGFFAVSSPRQIWDLRQIRHRSRASFEEVHSDADSLAAMTGSPAGLWELLFLLAVSACVGWSAVMVAGIWQA